MFKEVNPNPLKGMLAIKLALLPLFLLLAGCGGGGGGGVVTVTLSSINIVASTTTLPLGTSIDLTVIGTFSNGSTQDISNLATWQSSDPTKATVDSDGTIVSVAVAGVTTITATITVSGTVYTDTQAITVTGPALIGIDVNPPSASVAAGGDVQFTATGRYSDGSQTTITDSVIWASGSVAADVSNTTGTEGLASAASAGSAAITATLTDPNTGVIVGTATLTVSAATLTSIEITPNPVSLASGTTQQLTATGLYSDGSTVNITELAAWSSVNAAVTVSDTAGSKGLVTGVTGGNTVNITAQLNGGAGNKTDTVAVTVTNATLSDIIIQPANPEIAANTKQAFSAMGHYSDDSIQDITDQVTWSSGSAAATISNDAGTEGLATAVSAGSATITATLGISRTTLLTVKSNTLNAIHVTSPEDTLVAGTQTSLTATGNFSDGDTQNLTSQVTWVSTDTTKLIVDAAGRVTAVAAGTARISARSGSVIGSVQITVRTATLTGLAITPTNPAAITPSYTTMAVGTKQALTATATFSDATTQIVTDQVVWSSSLAIALVSNNAGSAGEVSALTAGGPTTIGASLTVDSTTETDSFGLTVSAATLTGLAITPTGETIGVGEPLALVATGTFSDTSNQVLTDQVVWTTSSVGLASVSNATGTQGQVTGIGAGGPTITATSPLGQSDSEVVTVSAAPGDVDDPISLTIVAAPNVIYTGTDSTTLTINVLSADNGVTVPDGTVVDLVVIPGSGGVFPGPLTTTTATTTSGSASITLSSPTAGLVVVRATVNGTSIQNTVPILATINFTDMIGRAATVSGNEIGGTTLEAGALFGLFATNLSNRTFSVDLFKFGYVGSLVTISDKAIDPVPLNNGSLASGEQMGYVLQTETDFPLGIFEAQYTLSDTPTAQSFSAGAQYDLRP